MTQGGAVLVVRVEVRQPRADRHRPEAVSGCDLHRRLIKPREARDRRRGLLVLDRGLAVVGLAAGWGGSDDRPSAERGFLAADGEALRRSADTRRAPRAQ